MLVLQTLKSRAVAAITDRHIRDISWVNDTRLVFDTEIKLTGFQRVDSGAGLFAVDAHGRSIRELVETRPRGGLSAGSGDRAALHWHFSLLHQPSLELGDEVLVHRPEEVSSQRIGPCELRWLNTRNGVDRDMAGPLHAQHWVFDTARRCTPTWPTARAGR